MALIFHSICQLILQVYLLNLLPFNVLTRGTKVEGTLI
jgi:hypothetical protein